jgi:hypothetical protein
MVGWFPESRQNNGTVAGYTLTCHSVLVIVSILNYDGMMSVAHHQGVGAGRPLLVAHDVGTARARSVGLDGDESREGHDARFVACTAVPIRMTIGHLFELKYIGVCWMHSANFTIPKIRSYISLFKTANGNPLKHKKPHKKTQQKPKPKNTPKRVFFRSI